jgi:hypothetical protein
MSIERGGVERRSFCPEPIPDSEFRYEITGMGGSFLQFVPQLPHVDPQIVSFLHMEGPPDFL